MVTELQAKSLAIRYGAVVEMVAAGEWQGVARWARLLDEIQQETGVVLRTGLDQLVARAEEEAAA